MIRFIDLFAGIGGIRKGFELACAERGIETECVFTSEIKPAAVRVLKQNHPGEEIHGDIRAVDAKNIPPFDFLLGGFPCQAFSIAGKKRGFEDARGTLFFEIARILKERRPEGFLLENVEGLVLHDRTSTKEKVGRTLQVILGTLEELGYNVSWRVLDASDFGIPQKRRRIYITGTLGKAPDLSSFPVSRSTLGDVLEHGKPTRDTPFVRKLLEHIPLGDLKGKAIKDKRGGTGNIHSWDFELKGPVTPDEKELLDRILHERRKKKWAEEYGVEWMDGMPLTERMIGTFWEKDGLHELLGSLVSKGYLRRERPKRLVKGQRVTDDSLELGYNIIAGRMSFEVGQVLDPEGFAPTLVATGFDRIHVIDDKGIRPLTLREGLRLFGYPEDYKLDASTNEGYDLLGNTVVVPVIKAVAGKLLEAAEITAKKEKTKDCPASS